MRWPGRVEDADGQRWLIVAAAALVALTIGLFVLGDALDDRPEPVRLLSQAQALERVDRAETINIYLRIIRDYPGAAPSLDAVVSGDGRCSMRHSFTLCTIPTM